MKILIDLQSLQTGSAQRGIGRYSRALTLALIDELKDSDVFVLLNDSKNDHQSGIALIQEKIGEERIIRFPLAEISNPALSLTNDEVRLSKILRERFIEALAPDIVLIASLFEFEALSTIPIATKRSYLCAVILYDLIPLSNPESYLSNSVLQDWYEDRLIQLKNADALLSISEYVRQDAIARLKLSEDRIKNISAGTNLGICRDVSGTSLSQEKFLNEAQYILYVGGFDKRKNLESLIACYARLPKNLKKKHRLVLAGGISDSRKNELEGHIKQHGLSHDQVLFYGFVDDEVLVDLYKNAILFVFPSSDEGFGLPPLEAMTLGTPTISSNCASLPEVVGNDDALFDPTDPSDFLNKMALCLSDEKYREQIKSRGLTQSLLFSWENSARTAIKFILERNSMAPRGVATRYLSFRDFLQKLTKFEGFEFNGSESGQLTKLLVNGVLSGSDAGNAAKSILSAAEFRVVETFSSAVPNYSGITAPYVFSSMVCREQHFHLPLYTYWCRLLGEKPRLHRKQWEFVYICQTLYERGYLREGLSAVGFGVGKEPLVSYFASCGVRVLATDLDFTEAKKLGWVATDQHSDNLNDLNKLGLCEAKKFKSLVSFRNVDMNKIPEDIGSFDFCWSSCAFEHLGSIRQGLDFVINSSRLLRPGGVAVHTTEFNITSNSKTLDNNPSFVIFRRRDIELLVDELEAEGYEVEPIDFSAGDDELERYIDRPPYIQEPHLRLELDEYVASSIGIIVRAPGQAK